VALSCHDPSCAMQHMQNAGNRDKNKPDAFVSRPQHWHKSLGKNHHAARRFNKTVDNTADSNPCLSCQAQHATARCVLGLHVGWCRLQIKGKYTNVDGVLKTTCVRVLVSVGTARTAIALE